MLSLQLCVVERPSQPKWVARRIDESHAVTPLPTPHQCLGGGWVGMKLPASSFASGARWLGAMTTDPEPIVADKNSVEVSVLSEW